MFIINIKCTITPQPITPSAPLIGKITQPDFINPLGSVIVNGLPASGTWSLIKSPYGKTTIDMGTSSVISDLPEGIHNFSVKNSSDCESELSSDVVINKLTAIITQSNSILTSNAANGNQWYNQNSPVFGAIGQTYTVTEKGNYYTVVTIPLFATIPSNTISVFVTGEENIGMSNQINLYPVPVKNELVIEFKDNNEPVGFEIINSLGQVIQTGSVIEKTKLQTENFATGLYLIKFKVDNTVFIKKFLKE